MSRTLLTAACLAGTLAAVSGAEPAAAPSAPAGGGNAHYVWILLAGALVFFMQAGFALLELGSTRTKNAINIMMKNFLDFCVASLGFLFIGFPLMFGESAGGWIGTSGFDLWRSSGTDPVWIYWFFQVVFCGTAATIVSGAMAERTRFIGYILFSAFISMVIYPLFGHWAWGGGLSSFLHGSAGPEAMGWLQKAGFRDFAGGAVVHTIGGACSLAGILCVGPRAGRFDARGNPVMLTGHNLPLAALGTFILWFCWFGFNAGSSLMADVSIGRLAANTNVAAAAGAMAAMASLWRIHGRPDLAITLNGALAGLVAITPACANVNPGSAVVIGLTAGLLTTWSTLLMEKHRLDDAVGAVPVHLVGGVWGCLAVELFDEKGFQLRELGIQALGAGVATAFAFLLGFAAFRVIQATAGLRASDLEQDEGLDFHEHAASAYPEFRTADQ